MAGGYLEQATVVFDHSRGDEIAYRVKIIEDLDYSTQDSGKSAILILRRRG